MKQSQITQLMDKVENLNSKLDQLEYDKVHTSRIKNVVMRELGKRAEVLQVDPYEVAMQKVQKRAEESVSNTLRGELKDFSEKVITSLISDFRREFQRELGGTTSKTEERWTQIQRDFEGFVKIMEKKLAMTDESLAARDSELKAKIEDSLEYMKGLLEKEKKAMAKAESRIKSIEDDRRVLDELSRLKETFENKVERDNARHERLERQITELSSRDIKKDLQDEFAKITNDIKKLESLSRRIDALDASVGGVAYQRDINDRLSEVNKKMESELSGLRKEVSSATKKTAVDIKSILRETGPVKSDIKELPYVVNKIEKLEKKVDSFPDMDRVTALEKLVNDALKPRQKKR